MHFIKPLPYFLSLLLLTALLCIPIYPQHICKCKQVPSDERAQWVFETIEVHQKNAITKIRGKVIDNAGYALPNSLVEVYKIMPRSKDLKYDPDKEGRRIALCKTGNDGQFCFNGMSSGNYMIVISKKDFCRTIVVTKLAMSRQKSVPKGLIITLKIGG